MRRGPRLPLEQLAPYLLAVPSRPEPTAVASSVAVLDWRSVFGNENPVEIEVGFGKGLFLLTTAQAHPDINYLGIEILRKYQLYTATRLARHDLGNVRLACADARYFLRHQVPANSVRALHVYFPDPWWKKRHQKRRLFTSDFVQAAVDALRPNGYFSIATDVADYAEMVAKLLAAEPRLERQAAPPESTPTHDLDYLTNFERKFRKQGKTIYRFAYVKS